MWYLWLRVVVNFVCTMQSFAKFVSDHFSGPGGAIGRVCAYACVQTVTFELICRPTCSGDD